MKSKIKYVCSSIVLASSAWLLGASVASGYYMLTLGMLIVSFYNGAIIYETMKKDYYI